jgi:hypothetical protein
MRFDLHPFKDAEAAREWARNIIDQSAGAARARYITVTQGQDATYQAKYAEAQAFARAGYPDDQIDQYPWVREEAAATRVTPRAAADEIKANGDPWNMVLGPKIEGLRIGGKTELPGLNTISSILIHARAVMALLDAV